MSAGGLNHFPGSLLIMKLVARSLAERLDKDAAIDRMTELLPDEVSYWEEINEKPFDREWFKTRMDPSNEIRNNQLKLTNAVLDIIIVGAPIPRDEVEELWKECQNITTKTSGRVYIFASKKFPRLYKVGMTIESAEARLAKINYDWKKYHDGKSAHFKILFVLETGSWKRTKAIEQIAIIQCAINSDQPEGATWRTEYFLIDPYEAIGAVKYAQACIEIKENNADPTV